eukprot:CAMPEP_0201283160 /NCGR_PEP_ID=MMETSP1317-20130820/7795_1 /ASSEMBLY_ACC=CAM_ASM_000770 /TAXON_ID=187299 /ORGANISM="Undescribed Undescribed, Strain Undescribed" /LENGTH=80 /DNA_ID=CAMNT_0047598447 /DNA_START=281 /DNA_END=523 /DNA_ORIENTATION=-
MAGECQRLPVRNHHLLKRDGWRNGYGDLRTCSGHRHADADSDHTTTLQVKELGSVAHRGLRGVGCIEGPAQGTQKVTVYH